ncbi:hypothetical protein PA598K_04248 [Paenibacillus sp. 598K]|uniref:DUF4180 domain-containing protein n=1 Tax=Paenibacillus sp. 598K TaxID=1117987 RepID=UPI000FF93245|nr:DUF4180 domain-containing protein [Paenibacillus sp. 598K]GBF75816.1 hypothetical protein PA598K_04248 [Paenibacillus sp. 598K]
MNIEQLQTAGAPVALVRSWPSVIDDEQTALDLMMTVRYETGCDRIILPKERFSERFFDLSTRLAGGILQKAVNYQVKLAIVGDFSQVTSKSLRDFIYECNEGRQCLFLPSEEEAAERLGRLT